MPLPTVENGQEGQGRDEDAIPKRERSNNHSQVTDGLDQSPEDYFKAMTDSDSLLQR